MIVIIMLIIRSEELLNHPDFCIEHYKLKKYIINKLTIFICGKDNLNKIAILNVADRIEN